MAMDNFNGDETFIIIYGYKEIDYAGIYNTSSNTINEPVQDDYTKKYRMAYQVNGGGVQTIDLAQYLVEVTYKCTKCMSSTQLDKTQTSFTQTITGYKIDNVSVQINAGLISYTYTLHDASTGTFDKRIIGIISINDTKFPIGEKTQWEYGEFNSKYAIGVVR
jgi:hypothetical protein